MKCLKNFLERFISSPKEYGGVMELNKIYCGDCLSILPSFPPKSVDMILCDPPYGVNLGYDVYKDTEDNWYKLMTSFLPEAIRVAKLVILPSCQIKRLKWIYENFPPDWLICWYKGSTGCSAHIGFNDWEPHLVYGKIKGLCMHDYFFAKCETKKKGHPCPKSVDYASQLILKATKPNHIILDPFIGSGTTAVACEKLGRKWIGIELSAKYCEISKQKIEDERNQLKMSFV